MNKHHHPLRLSLYALFVLTAVLIVIDFFIPGNIIHDDIVQVKKEQQQYYKAANNSHQSYKVITNKHQFSVKEDFVGLKQNQTKIEYSVSKIFNEINWYRLPSSKDRATTSLRIAAGFVIPILVLITMLLSYFYNKNLDTLVFVLQALLIADLVYLLK